MNPGDSVWFLLGDEIVKGMVRDVPYYGRDAHVDVTYRALNAAGQVVTRLHSCRFNLLFESREALCEHYRKIFEL